MIPGEQVHLIFALTSEDQIALIGIFHKAEHHTTRRRTRYGAPCDASGAQAHGGPYRA